MEHLGTDETKNNNQDDLVESSGAIDRERKKEVKRLSNQLVSNVIFAWEIIN